jgi:hypothetical protein
MTSKFFPTADSPYGSRILRLIGDARKVEATGQPLPDLLWVKDQWWLCARRAAWSAGVRFRIEGDRLRLLPARSGASP